MIIHARKTGRCADGFQRDAGRVVHLVEVSDDMDGGWTRAFCGTRPGRLSAGWSTADDPVTCSICAGFQPVADRITDAERRAKIAMDQAESAANQYAEAVLQHRLTTARLGELEAALAAAPRLYVAAEHDWKDREPVLKNLDTLELTIGATYRLVKDDSWKKA